MSILRRLESGIRAATAEQTMAVAKDLAGELGADVVLGLSGDLGAGKTTFVKGLAAAWGITATVTSPTYNIFTIHTGTDRQLVHMDAYRLDGADSIEDLMLEEFLRSPYCLAVEWPENVAGWMPPEALWLRFAIEPGNVRSIRFDPPAA